MKVHRYTNTLPPFRNAVVTIGTFDGVHTGHLQIIEQVKERAAQVNGESVIITFHPHPRRVVGGQQNDLRLLNTLQERIELLEKSGIDHLVIVAFTEDFASQTALDYIEHFLVAHFRPNTLIIGYDHRFGKNREGNYQLLEALKEKHGYEILEISEKVLNNVIISSTRIRQAILNGNINDANVFLGYPYFIQGVVVEGNKLGRTIGYPTANIRITDEEKLIPSNGVYSVGAFIGNDHKHLLGGMMNIGVRPTVDGITRTVEVNLFDFNKEIYGEVIRVFFYKRMRGEVKFDGLDSLKNQLGLDEDMSREIIANYL